MRVLRWLREMWRGVLRGATVTAPVLLGMGLLLMLLGAGSWARSWEAVRGRVRAEATVTENVASFAPGGGVVYSPRLRFRVGGEVVQVVVQRGDEDAAFAPGENVPVMFDAGDPQHVLVATAWSLYAMAIVLGVVGVAVFDVGLVLLFLARRKNL